MSARCSRCPTRCSLETASSKPYSRRRMPPIPSQVRLVRRSWVSPPRAVGVPGRHCWQGPGSPKPPWSVGGPEVPVAGDPFERALAAVGELHAGTDHEILDGARDEHLARAGERAHPGADVHADAGDVPVPALDLARVKTRADLDAERPHRLLHGSRGADALARAVEGGEESVAGALHHDAAVARDRAFGDEVVLLEQVPPRPVAHCGGARR